MKTELVHLPSMLLGGVCFYGDPFCQKGGWDSDNEIGKTCSRFIAFAEANPQRPYSCGRDTIYEVHIYGDETASKGNFEVFVGEEVRTAELPIGLSVKWLPAGEYLKITLAGQEIMDDWWQTLDTEILPAYHAKRRMPYIVQAYDSRFQGIGHLDASVIDAYIPVERQ